MPNMLSSWNKDIIIIINAITLSNMHIRFVALNLGTPDRFRKEDILSSSSCHAV